MSMIEQGIEVDVPVKVAYDQWTQFEEFPQFMEGVVEIKQLDDRTLRWITEIAGVHREWTAEITEQIPDDRIAWRSIEPGVANAGVVTFHRLADSKSRVMLQLEFDPEGFAEKAGDMLGIVKGRVKGDMERFKEFIESRGTETGGWRGEIKQDRTNV